MNTTDAWPAGKTWVFQGTVAEDATGGTHVCSLIVTPGAGNELVWLVGSISSGATATVQTGTIQIDDGANVLTQFLTQVTLGNAVAWSVPNVGVATPVASAPPAASLGHVISGTMRLKLSVSTTAVSVTQAFAVVCRIKNGVPTATLADSVGTPVLTTNTNKVF